MIGESPVPTYFGWRYILWFIWSHAITGLMILQAAFAAVLLIADSPVDPDNPHSGPLIAHTTVRLIIIGNAILCAAIAQIKQHNPVPDRPIANLSPPSKSESP
jgi:hypothetical protein